MRRLGSEGLRLTPVHRSCHHSELSLVPTLVSTGFAIYIDTPESQWQPRSEPRKTNLTGVCNFCRNNQVIPLRYPIQCTRGYQTHESACLLAGARGGMHLLDDRSRRRCSGRVTTRCTCVTTPDNNHHTKHTRIIVGWCSVARTYLSSDEPEPEPESRKLPTCMHRHPQ